MPSRDQIEEAFAARRRMLWGLGYRLTGVAADADDIVQETFLRALERPPARIDAGWHGWLVRVATNLGLDRLRARRRRAYVGPWLPSPIELAGPDAEEGTTGEAVDVDYERMESLSYAFLVALEVLTPRARAVLILREVFDYPVSEVATLLDTTEANVRVLHHRAVRRLEGVRPAPRSLRDLAEPTRRALQALVSCMARQDAAGLEALLTASARTLTDGGGRYTALRAPIVGAGRVARFHLETGRRRMPISTTEIRWINGLPALVISTRPLRRQMAPTLVLRCELDRDDRISELHAILAPRKLSAVRFAPPPAPDDRSAPPPSS